MNSVQRLLVLLVACLLIVSAVRRGKTVAATKFAHPQAGSQSCSDGKGTVRRAWALEEELTNVGMSTAPATNARSLYKEADGIERQLLQCEVAADAAHEQEQKDMYSAERINLQFIATSQIAYGGLGSIPNPRLPADLGTLAPACKDVLDSRLPARIDEFAKANQDTSALKTRDVAGLYSEANSREGAGLTICAQQASNVGYKDAAFLLLTEALTVENLMHIATLNEQASIIKAFGEVRPNTPVAVNVGPRHCTASIRDWGWQKTVDWDCF